MTKEKVASRGKSRLVENGLKLPDYRTLRETPSMAENVFGIENILCRLQYRVLYVLDTIHPSYIYIHIS